MHPQLSQDRKLAQVSREARYTFVLTWTISDDEGLFRAEPRQLLGQLYPYDPDLDGSQLEAWLSELVVIGVLRWRQTKDGARIGEVVNWRRHQKIDRPSKSFLASQIDSLAADARQTREDVSSPSLLESRVLSPESRVLSPESGGVPATATESLFADTAAKLDAPGRAALEGYYRAARHPDALMIAVLAESPDGIHARAEITWDVLGRALAEMRAAGKEFGAKLFRAYCWGAVEQGPGQRQLEGRTPAQRAHARAEQLAREAAP